MNRRILGPLTVLATLSLPCQAEAGSGAAPPLGPQQEPDGRLTSVLSGSEQQRLNKLAAAWFEAEEAYAAEEQGPRRDRLREATRRARQDFTEEWERKSEKHGDLLAHVGDLLAIFDAVYPYPRESGYGAIKSAETPSGTDYKVVPPRGYRASNRYAGVLVLPERDDANDRWLPPRDQFDGDWKDNDFASEAVLIYPRVPDDLLLDGHPGEPSPQRQIADEKRIAAVLAPFGAAGVRYHFDRSRLLLDCSKGSCAYGLRMATYFPVLFAGIVLRHPTDPGDISLDSLSGTPVLLLRSQDTRDACEKIQSEFEKLQPGTVTVLDAGDAGEAGEIEDRIAAWAKDQRRDLYRPKIAVGVNHDRFMKSSWIVINRAEPVGDTPLEQRPHLVAEADREANRITVDCRGIAAFTVLLNDVLVDLDQDVTVIVNGKVATMKRVPRRLSTLVDFIRQRRDPTNLFTATLPVLVEDLER